MKKINKQKTNKNLKYKWNLPETQLFYPNKKKYKKTKLLENSLKKRNKKEWKLNNKMLIKN